MSQMFSLCLFLSVCLLLLPSNSLGHTSTSTRKDATMVQHLLRHITELSGELEMCKTKRVGTTTDAEDRKLEQMKEEIISELREDISRGLDHTSADTRRELSDLGNDMASSAGVVGVCSLPGVKCANCTGLCATHELQKDCAHLQTCRVSHRRCVCDQTF